MSIAFLLYLGFLWAAAAQDLKSRQCAFYILVLLAATGLWAGIEVYLNTQDMMLLAYRATIGIALITIMWLWKILTKKTLMAPADLGVFSLTLFVIPTIDQLPFFLISSGLAVIILYFADKKRRHIPFLMALAFGLTIIWLWQT